MIKEPIVLVTGAAGFIGSAFVRSCNIKGIRVISVDHAKYFSQRTEHKGIEFGEIVDRDQLFDWLKSNRPTLNGIIHLGACANTMQLDEEYLKKMNLEYSQKLWSFATQERLPFVYASSAATYGDGSMGYDDDETKIQNLKPLNPYGESKRLFDLWALEQERNGFKPPIWSGFKFFNVYGLGERHKEKMASVVLHAFDQIEQTGRVKLFKSHRPDIAHGHQKRDFIFVNDVIQVLYFAWGHHGYGPIVRGIYNLGTGQARTYLDLARAVFVALKKPEQIEFIDTPESIRDRYQYFTEAKMDRLRQQGYRDSFTTLEQGVAQYISQLRAW
jgi:ADP-L-glycero-D-manno-heptose 6-epimerase